MTTPQEPGPVPAPGSAPVSGTSGSVPPPASASAAGAPESGPLSGAPAPVSVARRPAPGDPAASSLGDSSGEPAGGISASSSDGSSGDGSLGDGSLGDGSLGDGSLGGGSLGDGSSGDGSLGDGSSGGGEAAVGARRSGLRNPAAAVRGLGAGTLGMEALVLLLAIQPIRIMGGHLGGWGVGAVVALALFAAVLAGMMRRRWAWGAGTVLQALLIVSGLLHWSLAVLGLIFGAAWAYATYVRRTILS